jgi:predicted nuclease with RNAse H fold
MQEIKGIARVKFLPGKLAEWKRLTEQAMEIVRTKDTGTLQYDIPVLGMHPGMAARCNSSTRTKATSQCSLVPRTSSVLR